MTNSKYDKLDKAVKYDKEAVEQLAEALNEIIELEAKIADLNELVRDNTELQEFVWRTQENKVIAIHNLETDHLANIVKFLAQNGRGISKAVRAEARERGIIVPTTRPGVDMRRYIDATIIDEELV